MSMSPSGPCRTFVGLRLVFFLGWTWMLWHATANGVQELLAEYLGTLFLTLTIVLSIPTARDPVPQPFAVALSLCAMIYAFDHVSCAHWNPAVTLGACLAGGISPLRALMYMVAQFLGGLTGVQLGLAISSAERVALFTPSSLGSCFLAELAFTTALVLVMQNAGMTKNTCEPNSYFGIAVAFTVLAGASSVGSISGGCFNPAVGVGIDVAAWMQWHAGAFGNSSASMNSTSIAHVDGATLVGENPLSSVWVYLLAPCTGAVLASGIRKYMNLPSHAEAVGLPLVVPLTEFVGTFYITLTAALTGSGLAIGAMLLGMVYMGDHVCGADYNPAVTLGVALRMGVPLREYWKVAATMAAQFAGAFAAAGIAFGINRGVVNYPASDIVHGVMGAVLFEAVWTALLVFVVCCVMTHSDADTQRRGDKDPARSFQGLAIGFVVVAGVFCATASGGGSGGMFNPAMGSAIVIINAWANAHPISSLWVYWIGPFGGSALGAGLFALMHYHRDPGFVPEEDSANVQPFLKLTDTLE